MGAEIPGRGWSSPIVNGRNVFLTTVTTEGKSKVPQIGTEYSTWQSWRSKGSASGRCWNRSWGTCC